MWRGGTLRFLASFASVLPSRLASFASRWRGRAPRIGACWVRRATIGAPLAIALSAAPLAARAVPPGQPAAPGQAVPARYESCAGWGLCTFRLLLPVPPVPPAAAAPSTQAADERVQVRLRGVGDAALPGTCAPEREAARTIRAFVEGVLARATRIELDRIEPRSGGTVLATVRVDGTDVRDILVHIGLGRGKPLPPDATWCD